MKELLDGFSVERLEEIVEWSEVFGRHARLHEIASLARIALEVKKAQLSDLKRYDLDQSNCDSCGQHCGAMFQAAPVRSSMPDGVVMAEHLRVIEMLLNVCGAAFELADDSCQQDVDGEECHVVPDDAFQKLSDALDEIENTLQAEDIDRTDVFLAWAAMPRASLKSILQAGNSPVIPDGYILIPKIPARAHLNSIAMRYRHDFYLLNDAQKDSALAAARQMYEECSGQGFYSLPATTQPGGE